MAIGSPDKASRLGQLSDFARCQVWAGYGSESQIRAEVYAAALDEEHDAERAGAMTEELLSAARQSLAEASAAWPATTPYDRLHDALEALRDLGVVVLEAVDDHWAAGEELDRLAAAGRRPLGIAYFTQPDVWHSIQHGMLELNVWHGDSANVAPGDVLLELVLETLAAHGIAARFDEGRIEAAVVWQRRSARGG